jgi:antitoxin (DNA-binding transcriptional repressor) of toxin-antitoxin stability system
MMATITLRQFSQDVDALVRRAQSGETITIEVAGRPAAELGPVHSGRWRRGTDLAAIFHGEPVEEFAHNRDVLSDLITDPFEPR